MTKSNLDPFVHLHVHGVYSILDGHTTIEELMSETAKLRQPAVGMTEHGSLGGARKLWEAATAVGIKPIIGCEFYVAPSSRFTKKAIRWGNPDQRSDDVSGAGAYTHLTVLADSVEGLTNLFRLQSTAYADGFYYKPRIDLDVLAEHNRGLLVATGCAGGAVATRIRLGQRKEAFDQVSDLRDIFGDRLYVEVMYHDNPIDDVINPTLIEIARELGVPLVATNDSHYTTAGDAKAHDALLCVQTGQRIDGVRRFKFEGTGYHLRSHWEMEKLFGEIPDALKSTLAIAERVGEYSELFKHVLRLPNAPTNGEDPNVVLKRKLSTGQWSDREKTRLEYELDVISGMGFANYLLVVEDIVSEAKRRGMRVGPGRGSAGGSLIAKALGIIDLDPLEHGLLFERFLNPERVSVPDIDIDVQDNRRDELLDYIVQKYGGVGGLHVAQLGTYGTIGAKSALHDSARVLGRPRIVSDKLTYRLPPAKFGRTPSLSEGDWSGLSDDDTEVVEIAKSLEGRIRNQGVHASGVIISPEPLNVLVPLYRPKGEGAFVTSFDMGDIEKTGLVKFDFLGLKNLSVIDNCMIHLEDFPWEIPVLSTKLEDLTDPKTYELLQTGNTLSVFQFDSPGMQSLLKQLKPTSFDDIAAMLALYRPGPMAVNAHSGYAKRKNNKEKVTYPHRELEGPLKSVLAPTYGFIVFQEQVLEILKICCGYTYATAEGIFNAMRKKDTKKMLASKPDFVSRMKSNGYSDECISALWDILVPFSDYSFNKSHSAGYGVVSYWTAYLKANHQNEYMASVLSAETDPKKLPQYIAEVERMNIPILAPDINASASTWTPTEQGIRYGLKSIKGFGEKAFENLLKNRPFKSLDDFFRRADRRILSKGTLGVLVQSGALDSLCPHRSDLFLAHTHLSERALADRALRKGGQVPLYASTYEVKPSTTTDYQIRQQWEKELLGTIISQQPVTVTPKRWLDENEFYYIKEVIANHPGKTELLLQLGYATIPVGRVEWSDAVRTLLGGVDVAVLSE